MEPTAPPNIGHHLPGYYCCARGTLFAFPRHKNGIYRMGSIADFSNRNRLQHCSSTFSKSLLSILPERVAVSMICSIIAGL